MSNAFTRTMGQPTPQSESARPDQVANNAGGFVFQVDDMARLERFLILGTDGGTYYVSEKKLTKDNVGFLISLIERDEQLVIDVVRDISVSGRAYRNSPAIFAVAAVMRYGKTKPKGLVREVCRTATHLFEYAEYTKLLGGWNRSNRASVAQWYTDKRPDQLAYQVVKYRQRNGWSHKDMIRLAHPVGLDRTIGNFILGKETEIVEYDNRFIYAFKLAQNAQSIDELVRILNTYPDLPWEAVPTSFHKNVELWKTLFYNGALKGQALVRNITRLARLSAFDDMVFAADYAAKLVDEEMIQKTRLHPIQYLLALVTYTEGQMDRQRDIWYAPSRNKDWTSVSAISKALDDGFYKAFKYVEPANKRTMICLDVSGSMSAGAMGIDLSCNVVSAAMAMTIARTEPYHRIMAFDTGIRDLGIDASSSLNDVKRKVTNINGGGTDCSLPMVYAGQKNIDVDTFVVITDNETWAGRSHPFTELKAYRRKTGIDAKLVVVALTATEFTIADPTDRGMLDVVGGDTNLPSLISSFSAGRV